MLRKRIRSLEKDQQKSHLIVSDSVVESYFNSENHKNNSFFGVPSLFVGLTPKGLSDSDSVWSPTSPLDFRVFSNLGNPFRSPRSSHCGQQKSWDTSKVGLRIIDSLENDTKLSGKVLRSESKNILFGPQMRIKTSNSRTHIDSFEAPKSLPKNYAILPYTQIKSTLQKGNSDIVFEIEETALECEPFGKIRSCSLGSCKAFPALSGFTDRSSNVSSRSFGLEKLTSEGSLLPLMIGGSPNTNNFSHVKVNSMSLSNGSGNEFTETLSADKIEFSEDYTRVISHGPNPRTTHIYGDSIVDCHTTDLSNSKNETKGIEGVLSSTTSYPSDGFLSFCYSCNKKLEGKDIYMYRGEKAFCSLECRSHEILIDDEVEENMRSSESPPNTDDCEVLFETGIFFTA